MISMRHTLTRNSKRGSSLTQAILYIKVKETRSGEFPLTAIARNHRLGLRLREINLVRAYLKTINHLTLQEDQVKPKSLLRTPSKTLLRK